MERADHPHRQEQIAQTFFQPFHRGPLEINIHLPEKTIYVLHKIVDSKDGDKSIQIQRRG